MSITKTQNEQQMKAAKRKDARMQLLAQMQSDPDDKHHGSTTGYKAGCRCDRCYRAWRMYQAYGAKGRVTAKQKVLNFLKTCHWDENTTQTEIAKQCGISKAACSVAVAQLSREGMLVHTQGANAGLSLAKAC